jgi:hypothetical protein
MHAPSHRSIRGLVVVALATAAFGLTGATALAAHPIGSTGSPGGWTLPDSAANPAARCSYSGGGVLGGTHLTGIRQRNEVEIAGTTAGLRSVAVRPIIQHKVAGTWITVRRGTLVSGNASLSSPAVLSTGLTTFGVTQQPKNPFRLALKLIWYRADASVKGTRTILVDSYVKRDSGVGSRCAGFVSDVAS